MQFLWTRYVNNSLQHVFMILAPSLIRKAWHNWNVIRHFWFFQHTPWPGLVAFTVTVSAIHGLHWKWWAHVWNDGLTLEMMGSHFKWWADIRNDRLMFKMMSSHSKQWADIQNDGLTFKMMGWHSKWQAHVQNNGLVFETMGSHLKQWAYTQNGGLMFDMTGIGSVGGVHRCHIGPNARLSSGGGHEGKWGNWETSHLWFSSSCTWWVSNSMCLISYLSTPSQIPISH